MNSLRRLSAVVLLLTGLGTASAASAASAADGAFYGLLRDRDLTPFGFLRLDMRPAHAVEIVPGTWALETTLGYQNTWALSPNVEKYLTSIEKNGRHELGPADYDAIKALPGENYLLDVESALLDVTFHYKLSTHWTGYATATAISYQGGFLDSTIEKFHDTFGFSTFGRPAAKKNDVNLIYDLKSQQLAYYDSPTDGGFTDPTFGMRYVGVALPKDWNLTAEVAVKVPVAGKRLLLSTGRTDYGTQVSLQKFIGHHAWYLSASAVYYDGSSEPSPQDSQIIPTAIVGYEYQLTPATNFNLQGYISRSVYKHAQTDLDELLGMKYQYSLGVRHRFGEQFLFTFGITENLQNVNNTPDIGFQLGLAFIPKRAMGK